MAYGVINSDLITTSDGVSSAGLYGFKNRLINSDMRIDQRNAGAAVTINSTANTYTVDRWAAAGQGTDGVYTAQRSTTAPSGFTNSLLATVTTADASIGSTQSYLLTQFIEGLNASDLAWGTASAAPVTLSFWVRSSLTGTFGGCLQNSANDRSYPFSFTINSANTYEQKSITIAGDTTGTWLTDTGRGINVRFSLGVGSSYKTTAGAWAAGNYFAPTGSVDFISTLSATFYITGVQLEKGSTATSFDYRPYGTELALCQRYCFVYDAALGNGARILSYGRSTTQTESSFAFPVTLRSPVTGISVSSASHFSVFNPTNSGLGAISTLAFNLGDVNGATLLTTGTAGSPTIAAGNLLQLLANTTSGKIVFNGAEL